MLSDEYLAPGWEWRGARKVKKGSKHYIRVESSNFTIVGYGGRGSKMLKCPGGYPYLKLAVLTHCDDEIRSLVESRHASIRRNIG